MIIRFPWVTNNKYCNVTPFLSYSRLPNKYPNTQNCKHINFWSWYLLQPQSPIIGREIMHVRQPGTSLPWVTKNKETLAYLPAVTQIIQLWKSLEHYCICIKHVLSPDVFSVWENMIGLLCPQVNQRKWKIINICKRKTKQTSTKNQLYLAEKEKLSLAMHTDPSSKLCRTK